MSRVLRYVFQEQDLRCLRASILNEDQSAQLSPEPVEIALKGLFLLRVYSSDLRA